MGTGLALAGVPVGQGRILHEIRSVDGVDVQTVAEGKGPTVLVLHGGMSDESAWAGVAAKLARHFRVVRLWRRLYRTDVPADLAMDYGMEVQDVIALIESFDAPCLLVGHSSGAVVALEALLARSGAFNGAVRPRLTSNATIQTPTLLLTGQRSPERLRERVRLLAEAMPRASVQELPGQSHGANLRAPGVVAEHIAAFARSLHQR